MLSMGTEERGSTPTQKLPDYGDGSWNNPQVAAENQRYLADQERQNPAYPGSYAQAPSPVYPQPSPALPPRFDAPVQPYPSGTPAAYRAPTRRRPVLGFTRRLLCTLLMPLTLLTGLAGAFAYWADTTLVNTQRFTELTAPLATDPDFQQALGSTVTEDIMASPTLATYLGDGNSTAWYGGVQNWLYDQTQGLVSSATTSAVTSENFPAVWTQVVSDTHAYNFSGETRPALLDLSAVYAEAGSSVGNLLGFSLDTGTLPGRTLALDNEQGSYPINSAINTLIGFAGSWTFLLGLTAALALLGFLLWPGNRFAHLALLTALGAGLLWLCGLIGGGLSLTSGIDLPASPTALLFVQKIAEIMTGSYASFHYSLALYALLAAVGCVLLAILSAILRLTARATTAYTR